jgi:hypothetical protein
MLHQHFHRVSARRALLVADQAERLDPTGTSGLRRSFRAEAARRLAQLRRAVFAQLVEKDFMSHREDPLRELYPQSASDPGERLKSFASWFGSAATRTLASNWWQSHIERAWRSGVDRGAAMVGIPRLIAEVPGTHRVAATAEIDGIVAALQQQITRHMAVAARARVKPLVMHRGVLYLLRGVGTHRLNLFANTATVHLHNAGRLAAFRAAGVSRVGVNAERLPALRQDHLIDANKTREEMLAELEASNEAEAVLERLGISQEQLEAMSFAELESVHATVTSMVAQELEALRASPEVEAISAEVGRAIQAERAVSAAVAARAKRAAQRFAVKTAGDDRVCIECEDAAIDGPYDLDEAEDLLPLHPNCRCALVPAGEFTLGELLGEE